MESPIIDLTLPFPSFLQTCLQNASISLLWLSPDVISQIAQIQTENREQFNAQWSVVESEIIQKKINLLNLPCSLKSKLESVCKRIGMKIRTWYYFHSEDEEGLFNIPKLYLKEYLLQIKFTIHGSINKKAMITMMVRDERLPVLKRYEMACQYCLTDDIPRLYYEVGTGNIPRSALTSYWNQFMAGYPSNLNIHDEDILEKAILNAWICNFENSMRYIWEKISQEKKEEYLNIFITSAKYPKNKPIGNSIVRFMIGQMTNRQQLVDLLKSDNCHCILSIFKDYPTVLQRFYEFLNVSSYFKLLIDGEADAESHSKNSCCLVKFYWDQGPEDLKNQILTQPDKFGNLLACLLSVKFPNRVFHFLHILEDTKLLTNSDREALVFSESGFRICEIIIRKLVTERSREPAAAIGCLKYYFEAVLRSNEMGSKLIDKLDSLLVQSNLRGAWIEYVKDLFLNVVQELFPDTNKRLKLS